MHYSKRALLVILYAYCGCQQQSQKRLLTAYQADYQNVIGKKVDLGNPLLLYNSPLRRADEAGKYIILSFISTDCSNCIKKMDQWTVFLRNNRFSNARVEFVAQGIPDQYFKEYIKENSPMAFAVFVDTTGDFLYRQNLTSFSQNTFLLDSGKAVIMVGDPTKNKNVYDLYQEIINGDVSPY